MKSVRNHTVAALSLALLFGAGLAVADGGTGETKEKVQRQKDGEQKARPILAGPKVEDEAKSEAQVTRMGEQMRAAQRAQIPPLIWMRLVHSLDLTEAQEEKIEGFADAQRKAMREFAAKHEEGLQAIQSEMREARESGDRERMQEVMGKLRELRSKGPQPERVQNAIWEVLTAEQQDALKEKITAWQKEREERMRSRAGRLRGEGAPEAMNDDSDDDAMSDRPQRRRPAIGDRPVRPRGEGVRGRPGAAGEAGDRRPPRGIRPSQPQPERERERRRGGQQPD